MLLPFFHLMFVSELNLDTFHINSDNDKDKFFIAQ